MNEELREYVQKKMKESMTELSPLIEKFMGIVADAYEKGFWTGFHIGLSVEPKESEK